MLELLTNLLWPCRWCEASGLPAIAMGDFPVKLYEIPLGAFALLLGPGLCAIGSSSAKCERIDRSLRLLPNTVNPTAKEQMLILWVNSRTYLSRAPTAG